MIHHGKTARADLASEVVRFRAASLKLVELTRRPGFTLVPFKEEALPLFSALSEEARLHALTRLETMIEICEATRLRGEPIQSPSAILQTFFEHEHFTSVPGLTEELQGDDFVDVYDSTTHQLIFANNIIALQMSFSLEEMYCRPWTEMLARDVYGVHEQLYAAVQEVLMAAKPAIVSVTHIPDHVCREVAKQDPKSFIVFPRFFAPVYENGRLSAYICVNKVFPYDEPQDPAL